MTAVLREGALVSHYRVLERLGGGGMGVVYKAEDTRLGRLVACKFLPDEAARDPRAVERFGREACAASALNHPHICVVHDVDTWEGRSFMVMELLEGQTLKELVAGGPLPLAQLLDLAAQIADALHAAHEWGILHRDVKPANLFVTSRGDAKVLDFGLAKLLAGPAESDAAGRRGSADTISLSIVGTVPYMSPEQARGEALDRRTDVFSLGAVIYEMATGRPAFAGETAALVFDAILNRSPAPPRHLNPGLPAELERIIARALERPRELRYPGALELRADLLRLRRSLGTEPLVLEAAAHPSQMSPRSLRLAVLPLANLSRDPEQEYLADGMTDALIADLAQIRALGVISRTSAMHYKGSPKTLPEIARELHVDMIVEGSVLRSGDRVRITADLIHAATDQHLWARSYERDLRDVLALQREVSREIAREMRVVVTPQEQARLAHVRPVHPGAHEAYLKGKFHWQKFTAEGASRALEWLQQAIAVDPGYAPAHAWLSHAYVVMGVNGHARPREVFPRSREAALRAVEADPALADAHLALAGARFFVERDFAAATLSVERALELNPGDSIAHELRSYVAQALGRREEGIAEIEEAVALDPLSLIMNADVGFAYCGARRWPEAIGRFRRTLEMEPSFPTALGGLGMTLAYAGDGEAAVASFRRAHELDPTPPRLAALGYGLAVAGRREEAVRVAADLERLAGQRYVAPSSVALVYTGLGETQRALAWLERSLEENLGWLFEGGFLHVVPGFDGLCQDLRFLDLLDRFGLPR